VSIGAQADIFGSGANAFTLDFVNIGNAGNAADGSNYSAVGYDFRIRQKEVALDQLAKTHIASGNTIGALDEGYWNAGIRTIGTDDPAGYLSWNGRRRGLPTGSPPRM